MCYDLKTSIIALIINIIGSVLLFYISKDLQLKSIALFFLFVGVMQLWDSIFWIYNYKTTINRCSTKAAMIWNHFEPIILCFIIIYIMKKKLTNLSQIIIIIYTFFITIYTIYSWSKLNGTKKTNQSNDSLDWEWNHFKYAKFVYGLFLLCLIILFYDNFTGWIKYISIILTIASFSFSLYKYNIKASTGRFWCYQAAFAPLIYIIIHLGLHFAK